MKYFILAALILSACGKTPTENTTKPSATIEYQGKAMVMLDSARKFASATSLDLNATLELAEGREVDFHLSDGSSVTLRGPTSGKLGGLLEVDGALEKWSKSAMDVLNKSANEGHLMTVRSASISGKQSWMPTAINVPSNGNFCIQSGLVPSLYVPNILSSDVTFDMISDDSTVTLTIPAGENSEIEWPAAIPVSEGIEFKNKAWLVENKVAIIQLDTFDFPALAKAGCTDQLEKFRQFTR